MQNITLLSLISIVRFILGFVGFVDFVSWFGYTCFLLLSFLSTAILFRYLSFILCMFGSVFYSRFAILSFSPDLILCSFTDLALLRLHNDKFFISSFTNTPSCEMVFAMCHSYAFLVFNRLDMLKLIGLATGHSHDHDISRSMSSLDLLKIVLWSFWFLQCTCLVSRAPSV